MKKQKNTEASHLKSNFLKNEWAYCYALLCIVYYLLKYIAKFPAIVLVCRNRNALHDAVNLTIYNMRSGQLTGKIMEHGKSNQRPKGLVSNTLKEK